MLINKDTLQSYCKDSMGFRKWQDLHRPCHTAGAQATVPLVQGMSEKQT